MGCNTWKRANFFIFRPKSGSPTLLGSKLEGGTILWSDEPDFVIHSLALSMYFAFIREDCRTVRITSELQKHRKACQRLHSYLPVVFVVFQSCRRFKIPTKIPQSKSNKSVSLISSSLELKNLIAHTPQLTACDS